jgi:RNA polymerase sigma factor (sigma-70 family)
MSSITLFEQLRQNPEDGEVWRELVEHYSPWLFGWVTEATGHGDIAEDITSEVFLRMWRDRQSLCTQTEGSPRKWISVVVSRLITDWWRAPYNRRQRPLPGNDGADWEAVPARLEESAEDLDERLALAEQCERYVLAWESMASRSEMVPATVLSFLLRVRGKVSSEEAAEQLGLSSAQAVNTNVRRVRLYLAREVGLPDQHARRVDQLDALACEQKLITQRLERCAREYGYPPDSRDPS